MKLNYLKTIGLTSALLLTTAGSIIIAPQAKADSLRESTQLIAAKTSTNSFVSVKGHTTSGGVKIVVENGQRYLEFDSAFATDRGPDLKVVLHRNNSVGASIAEEDYISLAPLTSFRGTQRYLIPNNVDLDKYGSVAIWCRQFNVTFGYASL